MVKISVLLLMLCGAAVSLAEEVKDDDTFMGYGHARKIAHQKADTSIKALEEKYQQVSRLIKNSLYHGDVGHNSETVEWLATDQENWLKHRESNCWLQSYVYVYPAGSRMSSSHYDACTLEMNAARLKFLDTIRDEYTR